MPARRKHARSADVPDDIELKDFEDLDDALEEEEFEARPDQSPLTDEDRTRLREISSTEGSTAARELATFMAERQAARERRLAQRQRQNEELARAREQTGTNPKVPLVSQGALNYYLEYAQNVSHMESEIQRIVEQAEAEPHHAAPTQHTTPDTLEAVRSLGAEVVQLDQTLSALRERELPLTSTETEVAITALHDIATHSAVAAWRLGLHAVQQGLISQNKLAELLHASQMTVSRRYREGLDDTEEQKIARADARTLPL